MKWCFIIYVIDGEKKENMSKRKRGEISGGVFEKKKRVRKMMFSDNLKVF